MNKVNLIGSVASEFSLSHSMYGESFYSLTLSVKRDSGIIDLIPLLISDRLINTEDKLINQKVHIIGQFRSYNEHATEKSKLRLYVFVEVFELSTDEDVNEVVLEGFICKEPTYRHTPLGRQISDIILAVNRQYGKSDYIPCVVWGRNAQFVKEQKVGTGIKISGRIQSREYMKNDEVRIAYELSVNLLELC